MHQDLQNNRPFVGIPFSVIITYIKYECFLFHWIKVKTTRSVTESWAFGPKKPKKRTVSQIWVQAVSWLASVCLLGTKWASGPDAKCSVLKLNKVI